jgi:hypothetical protein
MSSIILSNRPAGLFASQMRHNHDGCRGRTLIVATDQSTSRVVCLSCRTCDCPQRCATPVYGGDHGAIATVVGPIGFRCDEHANV